MKRKALVHMTMLFLLLAAPAAAENAGTGEEGGKAQDFSFHGLHFRMKKEQVQKVFPTTTVEANEAMKPGHGMMFLSFNYDYRGLLMEIRAAYQRPEAPFAEEGLRRALREKFVQPFQSRYRNVAVSIDEFSNRAALVLVMQSLDMREEAVVHYRDEALKKME